MCSPPRLLQFKHQPLSVQSGDLLNHDQEVVHNDTARQMHEEEDEEVRPHDTSVVSCMCRLASKILRGCASFRA